MSYNEKAVVKIDSDGSVVKCAKGLAGGECGYSPNAKVCGKCGAMAVEVKMVPVMDEEEVDEEEVEDDAMSDLSAMPMPAAKKGWGMKKRPYKNMPEMGMEDEMESEMGMEDEMDMMEEDEEAIPPVVTAKKGWGMKKPVVTAKKDWGMKKRPYKNMPEMGMEDEMEDEMEYMEDEEDEEAVPPMPSARKGWGMNKRPGAMGYGKGGGMGYEADMDMVPDLEAMRMARLRKLGTKSADVGASGYICAIDRKVYPGATSVCSDCPGGCVAEKGMPGLLHVEGLVETMFKGDVVDSGYSQDADMFVVDVQTKSGHVNEVFVDGTTAEVLGFHRLDDSAFAQKSIMEDIHLIDFNEAAEIAVKSIPGTVVAVEPAVFEGFDSYQVEVDGTDGKSYDVYVALDGDTLGWDVFASDDTADLEAEAAEIALKRAFSDETRQSMAESGSAMSDGSFPIATEADLRNAIMAHGRAKDIDAAKAHIKKRAAALGLENMIPVEWSASEKSDTSSDPDEFVRSLIEFESLAAELEGGASEK